MMVATVFLGYVLPWGRMSFWATMVITGFFSVILYCGDSIIMLILGGWGVCNETLNILVKFASHRKKIGSELAIMLQKLYF